MIRISCRCGHVFEAPEDAAGSTVQCPHCLLANQVPRQDGLALIDREGAHPGDSPIPFAKPALIYTADATLPTRAARPVPVELMQPHNIVVMLFVLCLYLLAALGVVALVTGFYFIAPVLLVTVIAIVAHYGNVVNEIAVEERDELPRVLGDLRMHEDIWLPFAAVATAVILCFGPPVALFFLAPLSTAAAVAAAAVPALLGTYLFPATLLTLLSSGSIANLRPDRLLAVVRVSRKTYFRIAAVFPGALILCAWGMSCLVLEGMRIAGDAVRVPGWATKFPLGLAVLLIAIMVMHYYVWRIGLYHRENHQRFPWVGRFHNAEPRPAPQRKKPRYVAPPSAEAEL